MGPGRPPLGEPEPRTGVEAEPRVGVEAEPRAEVEAAGPKPLLWADPSSYKTGSPPDASDRMGALDVHSNPPDRVLNS